MRKILYSLTLKTLSFTIIVGVVNAFTVILLLANIRYYDSFLRVTSSYNVIPLIPILGHYLYISLSIMLIPLMVFTWLINVRHVFIVLVPTTILIFIISYVNPYLSLFIASLTSIVSVLLIILHRIENLYYLIEAGIVYEIILLAYWVMYIIGFRVHSTFIIGSMQLWSVLSILLTPLLAYTIVYSWVLRPFIRLYIRLLRRSLTILGLNVKFSKTLCSCVTRKLMNYLSLIDNRLSRLGLVIALTAILIILPRTHVLNPHGYTIGVDSFRVRNVLIRNNYDLTSILSSWEWGWDRLLTMTLFWLLSTSFNINPLILNEVVTSLLVILLPIAVYFLALKTYNNEGIAFWAAFLTPIGHQLAPIIYGGYSANVLALILSYFAIALFMAYRTRIFVVVAGLLVVLAFLSHIYLGIQLLLGFIVYYLIKTVSRLKEKIGKGKTIGVLGGFIAFIVSMIMWFNSVANELLHKKKVFGVLTPLAIMIVNSARRTLGNLGRLYYSSVTGYTYYLWGTYNNPLFYLLASISLLSSTTISLADVFLLGALPYIVFDRVIKTRLILNIPLQLYVAKILVRSDYRVKLFVVLAQLVLTLKYIVNAVPLTFMG